jgi:hypothetical protein
VKVVFNRWAEAELVSAARFLEKENRLGEAFLAEYESWEKHVKKFPESCPEIAPGIRCGYLKRFKYHVTYLIHGETLRILYVRSARQAPLRTWPRD